jgi:putative FmdB family regulatory protein
MILYDVKCDACGQVFEESQPMDTPQPTKCPYCKKKKCRHAFLKAVATVNLYSPLHPRKNRGRGY